MKVEAPQNRKIFTVFMLFTLIFVVLGFRLFWIQVIRYDFWKERAEKQHVFLQKILRKRGTIYDRNGYQLAFTFGVKKLICDPSKLESPVSTLKILAKYTHLPVESLLPRLQDAKEKSRRYFVLKYDVTMEEYEKIRDKIRDEKKQMGSPNDYGVLANVIYFQDAAKRYYPYNMIAANVLGFVRRDGKGLEGTEQFYDDLLKAEPGLRVYERGLGGLVIPNSERVLKEPEGGTSLYLTLDVVIQYLVERKLREAYEAHRPRSAVIVVMNPNNGEILAMASQPSFNPNYFHYYTAEDYRNRAIWEQFEPGSTMKVLTVAAALEENAITEADIFNCPGYIDLYDVFRIHCDKRSGHGQINCQEVLKNSCNVGAIQIAQRLGTRRLYWYLTQAGYGSRTGIQLPGEASGLLREPKDWSGLSLAALSIGQEIAVNAVQMASAFSALVNGGRLYRPKILAKTSPKDGEINDIQPMFLRRIISEETSKKVVRMLRTVTATDGSGKRAAIPGYPVAGKTGTAQSLADMHKVTEDLAGETTSKVIASFVGVVPADDPEVVIYVMFNRPKGEKYYGGQIAAPVFRELGEEILSYLKVKPRKEVVMPEQPYSAPWNAEDVRKQSQIDGVPSWLNLDVNEGRLAPAKPLHTEVAPATPAASVTKPENAEDVPPSWLVIPGAEAEENKEDDTLFMDLLMEEEASVWE